jgi:hypothetical protein|tara:strand:- start:559 stop:1035 length:477 start_codon:yes stop_codon:yes gene_type:complete
MKKILALICWLSVSWAAYPAFASDRMYGEALSDAQIIRIADLSGNPDKYVDQLVKLEGLVDDVCPMKGCWVDILDGQSRETIRFKVQDGVIEFPVAAKGSQIIAEGILRKHALSKDQAVNRMRHFAEEKGETFDERSITGATVFYQIEGLGAVVRDAQ